MNEVRLLSSLPLRKILLKNRIPVLLSALIALFCPGSSLRGQGSVIIAQVITGGTEEFVFQTAFKLLNRSRDQNTYKLELFRQDGEPLSAFDSRSPFQRDHLDGVLNGYGSIEHRTSLGPFQRSLVGWARITTSHPIGVAAVLLNFRRSDLEVIAGTGLTAGQVTDSFAAFADDLGVGSLEQLGIALVNPSTSQSAQIDFFLVQTDGTLAQKRSLEIGPGNQIAQFLSQAPLFSDLENVSPGSIEVRSSIPVGAALIRVDDQIWSSLPQFSARDLDLSGLTAQVPE